MAAHGLILHHQRHLQVSCALFLAEILYIADKIHLVRSLLAIIFILQRLSELLRVQPRAGVVGLPFDTGLQAPAGLEEPDIIYTDTEPEPGRAAAVIYLVVQGRYSAPDIREYLVPTLRRFLIDDRAVTSLILGHNVLWPGSGPQDKCGEQCSNSFHFNLIQGSTYTLFFDASRLALRNALVSRSS